MSFKTIIGLSSLGLLSAEIANIVVNKDDFVLVGGAAFIAGHGAPTGMALRSGNAGQTTGASFPKSVLAAGSIVQEISFSYRYISGYGADGFGHGSNLSLSISDEPLHVGGTVVYMSPHYTDYSYSANNSNYSLPVHVHVKGLSIPASDKGTSRLQIGFSNNDRNLQLLVPISLKVTCSGVDRCFVPAPAPPAPLPPLPPTPPPPATNSPWRNIGPFNIGDDIDVGQGGGEAGTIAPAVSPFANPNVMYAGGNNNAAASGVLKSVDMGKHWTKVNVGLFDTKLFGLFIVDDAGDHVLAGTPSGVFETLNGGQVWTHVPQTQHWGVANDFRNGTINGKKYVFVGANAGLGNVPLLKNKPLVDQVWNLIPSPQGSSAWRTNLVSVADYRDGVLLDNSVVGGCIWANNHGVVHIATVINETAADWVVQNDNRCQFMSMDPNNADHFIVNNASNGAHIYESWDGGNSYHGCLNKRGAQIGGIDRQGWLYCGSEGGAFRNKGGCVNGAWEAMYNRRTQRRTNRTENKVPHDYQRFNLDFAGGVAFGSDQGLFVRNGDELELISANGDMNNNVIMHPAIAEGEEPGETCIVTAVWDWGPIASWDSGKHWPSWQTPDDGSAMGYFGEGGGCFGMGKSKHVLCMHHYNIAYSSRCGKNMSRFIIGDSVAGHVFSRKAGSRSEPSGMVYAPMNMARPPWDTFTDKAISCPDDEFREDLGIHTSYSCLSDAIIGNGKSHHRWSVNVAVWRASDRHCYICKLAGNSSSWNFSDSKGDISYALEQGKQTVSVVRDDSENDDDDETDDDEASERKVMERFQRHVEKTQRLEANEEVDAPNSGLDLESSGSPKYVLKSWNFGADWTWILLPESMQGLGEFGIDPTNDTVLYGVASDCIARSYDQAETWEYCWQAPGLEGSFKSLVIKDSQTMVMMRNGDVPLRTRDGGASWQRLASVENLASHSPKAAYSWSGKTLALSTVVGRSVVWISSDDGDTWVDESGDYTAMSGGISQWYENTLYISSMGQGIAAKTFDEGESGVEFV